MKRTILLLLHLLSLVFLGYGMVLNMLKIVISADFFIEINLFNESRSVLGTLKTLWESANYLPFFLIALFGILVPVTKSAIIGYILLGKPLSAKWLRFAAAISKWAMADVFAISIFIAFLGAGTMRSTSAQLEPGFYFFTAYVLISAIIVGFLTVPSKIPLSSNA